MDTFAANLANVLQARNWTIKHLADLAGMTRANVSRIVNGKTSPTISTAETLCEAIGETLSAMTRDGFKPRKQR